MKELLKEFWIQILMVIFCIAVTVFAINYKEPMFNPPYHVDKPLNLETMHYNMDDINDIKLNEKQTLKKTTLCKKPKKIFYKSHKLDKSSNTYCWIDENGVKHFTDYLPEDHGKILKIWKNNQSYR